MNVGWDAAEKLATKNKVRDGIHVRLSHDDTVIVGAFCGEPFVTEVVWVGTHYQRYDPAVHKDKTPSLKVLLNIYLPEEKSMCVFEGTTGWFHNVVTLAGTHDFDEWLFSIKRHGDPGSKHTRYSVQPHSRMSQAQKKEIELLSPHDLGLLSGAKSKAKEMDSTKKKCEVDPFEL